jgi:CHAT domain-containing protein
VAAPLNSLGKAVQDREDLVKTGQYYHHGTDIETKLDPDGLLVAVLLNNLGNIAQDQGDLAKAEQYYHHALDIETKLAPGGMVETIESLGSLAHKAGHLGKAEQYYRQAIDVREKLAPGTTAHAELFAAIASILRDQQQPDAARRLYAQALDSLESQTARLGGSEEVRSRFRANHADIYKDYVDLLLALNQRDLAFEVLERSRARSLVEMLNAARIDIHKGGDPSLLERERSLQESLTAKSDRRLRLLGDKNKENQIAALTTEIEELEKQYQKTEERLRLNSPVYAALTQPRALTTAEIQQLLDTDTVLLEYSLGANRSYVFVVTPGSVKVYELPKQAAIESAAKTLYGLLSSRSMATRGRTRSQKRAHGTKAEAGYAEVAAKLSQMILASVEQQIKGKRLLIVGDGALQYIPFAALPSPESRMGSKVPLIAEHEIVNLPSASILSVLRREVSTRKAAPKAVMILADPVFDSDDDRLHASFKTVKTVKTVAASANPYEITDQFPLDRSAREVGAARDGIFPRLPFSRREAEAIYATATRGDATKALDFDASKATAMSKELGNYRIVHLATHGLVNSEHPALSGLVFSLIDRQGRSQDGFLRLSDIYNLELNADLVVLSACQTALGKQIQGEGLIGITRGFMYAGSPRVIASLWNADDEATAELMKKFYEGVLKNGQTPAEALRAAQMWMLKQPRWKAPYNWAGFILQGE